MSELEKSNKFGLIFASVVFVAVSAAHCGSIGLWEKTVKKQSRRIMHSVLLLVTLFPVCFAAHSAHTANVSLASPAVLAYARPQSIGISIALAMH